jgi:RNA polymerase sigma factor (sigma-70 family)
VTIDSLLDELEKHDERAARVVELRFFSGLTLEEVSAVIGVSPATVRDDWKFARTWLKDRLGN